MKSNFIYSLILFLVIPFNIHPQNEKQEGHINTNKFRQLNQEFSSPNIYRTASGAPGPAYYQQQADYKIDVELDDANKKIYGNEIITYTNNSPESLNYLWVQLDQNVRKNNSPSLEIESDGIAPFYRPNTFDKDFLKEPFNGGFNVEHVKDLNNRCINSANMFIRLA